MEATTGASLFLDSRSGFRPATAAEEVRTLFVARRPRAGSISWPRRVAAAALDKRTGNGGKKAADAVPNSNYVVPLDKASCLTRPLAEILRDLNKRVPDKIINTADNSIPWYHTNRMLSFYAPGKELGKAKAQSKIFNRKLQVQWLACESKTMHRRISSTFSEEKFVLEDLINLIRSASKQALKCWCGEVCDVTFSNHGSVTVVYRVTIRGSDGEAHRESTGTVSLNDDRFEEPVAAAEEIAFCKACARFGFGLYLYHEDQSL